MFGDTNHFQITNFTLMSAQLIPLDIDSKCKDINYIFVTKNHCGGSFVFCGSHPC
jgi:hypothetical protein